MIENKIINGRYRIIRTIGSGSYGDAFLVSDTADRDRQLVVKCSSALQEGNHKEARLLMDLDHPNIVKAYNYFLADNYICIVMKYFYNETIFKYLSKRKGDAAPYVEKWLAYLLSAVNYLHRQNILHRDIKLDNLFLDENFDLVLGDFGISRDLNLSLAKTFIGTPYHMSPEMFNNKPYSTKSDMWAVGCAFYHILEGQFPFYGTVPAIMQAVEKVYYKPITNTSFPVIAGLIEKMIVYDPGKRIDSHEAALQLTNVFAKFGIPQTLPLEPYQELDEQSPTNLYIYQYAVQQINYFKRTSQSNLIVKYIIDFFVGIAPSEGVAYNMILAYYFMTQGVDLRDICYLVHIDPAALSIPAVDWANNGYQSYLDVQRFMEVLYFEMTGLSNVDLLVKLAKQLVMISMFYYSE